MALTLINENSFPSYLALSSDIVDNKITGATLIGKTIYLEDTKTWKIISSDLTLSDYIYSTVPSGGTIENGSTLSAFGTPEVGELEPLVQLDFVYGLNTQTSISSSANGASVDTNAGRLRLQSGTSNNGTAYYKSRRPIKYRPGQGITARFTPIFATSSANSTQIMGCGDDADGYFFGYNGTSFGILHRNNGSPTWIPKENWNGVETSWVPSKGNPVMIKYPYLGYGNIKFYVQNSITSAWDLVHTIQYANTSASTQLGNPNLFFYSEVTNSGNTNNLTIYCGSVGIFLSGKRSFVGSPRWAMDSIKSSITTETNIITFKNATTYNGVENHSAMRLTSVSLSSGAASGLATFRFKINATLGGSPSYTPVSGSTANQGVTITSGNSAISYDVAGTTVAGGTYVQSFTVDNPDTVIMDLEDYNMFILPGETLTISGFASTTSTMGVALNWVEDI